MRRRQAVEADQAGYKRGGACGCAAVRGGCAGRSPKTAAVRCCTPCSQPTYLVDGADILHAYVRWRTVCFGVSAS